LKVKNKKTDCKFCKIKDSTREQIKDMARFLNYSEVEIVELLVSQYYKMQTIERTDEDGYLSIEFIPFFETLESYQQFKSDYEGEHEHEYPAIIIDRHNYKDYENFD